MNDTLHIACATDDSFAYPLAVTLTSCLENNKQHSLKVHLFSAALNQESIRLLGDLVHSYKQDFRFYRLEQELFHGLPTTKRLSQAAYYRILMPERIEDKVEKYLYIDADIIIAGDLLQLFKTDLENKIIAAVNDVAAIDAGLQHLHSIPDEYLYFNSGVLLVDKKQWLKNNITEKSLNYLKQNYKICKFHDQDALNAVLFRDRLPLSPVWNQQIGLYYVNKDVIYKSYVRDIRKALAEPVIIHFNGHEKPWNRVSGHPMTSKFRKFARKVEGFKYYEKFTLKKAIKRYLIYGILGWARVNRYYSNKAKGNF